MIVLTVFFKLLLWQTSTQPYVIFKVMKAVAEGKLCWDIITWDYLTVWKQTSSNLFENSVTYKLFTYKLYEYKSRI